MSREQKLWLVCTTVLFIAFMAVGWDFTVARILARSIQDSHQIFSAQLDQTKQKFIGDESIGQKTRGTFQKVKDVFQKTKQSFEEKQKAEQAILDQVKEELKISSY